MALPAILAKAFGFVLRRYGGKLTGWALAALGVAEIADWIQGGWRAVWGDDDEAGREELRQLLAAVKQTPGDVPPELLERIESALAQSRGESAAVIPARDVIVEEDVLAELERSEIRNPAADVAIQIVGRGHAEEDEELCR